VGPPWTHWGQLLSAQEAKEKLREIVEEFFFRRLRTEDGKRIRQLLVKSPPGLGKTKEAMEWATRYQTEREKKKSISEGRHHTRGCLGAGGHLRAAP
jgi:hypothetical protein